MLKAERLNELRKDNKTLQGKLDEIADMAAAPTDEDSETVDDLKQKLNDIMDAAAPSHSTGLNPLRNLFGFGSKRRETYQSGDVVKVRFIYRGQAERIWVIITNHCGPKFTGTLDNDPVVIPKENGDTVHFKRSQIVTD